MTATGVVPMGRVSVEAAIANYWDVLRAKEGQLPSSDVRRTAVSGIVDSGAARLVVLRNLCSFVQSTERRGRPAEA